MLFQIEFLRDLSDQASVCHRQELDAKTLTQAEETAWNAALFAWGQWKANAFQIRDVEHGGKIVVSGAFNLPTQL